MQSSSQIITANIPIPNLFTVRMPLLSCRTNSISIEGRNSHSTDLPTPGSLSLVSFLVAGRSLADVRSRVVSVVHIYVYIFMFIFMFIYIDILHTLHSDVRARNPYMNCSYYPSLLYFIVVHIRNTRHIFCV